MGTDQRFGKALRTAEMLGVSIFLGKSETEVFLDEFEEVYAEKRRKSGQWRALAWCCYQVIAGIPHLFRFKREQTIDARPDRTDPSRWVLAASVVLTLIISVGILSRLSVQPRLASSSRQKLPAASKEKVQPAMPTEAQTPVSLRLGARDLYRGAFSRRDTPPGPSIASPLVSSRAPSAPVPERVPALTAASHIGLRYNILLRVRDAFVPVPVDHVFRDGDRFAIELQANYSGYLYVFAKRASGTWALLVPESQIKDPPLLRRGVVERVPAANRVLAMESGMGSGVETLFVVLSRHIIKWSDAFERAASAAGTKDAAVSNMRARRSLGDEAVMDLRGEKLKLPEGRLPDADIRAMSDAYGAHNIDRSEVRDPADPDEPKGSVYVVNTADKPAVTITTRIELRRVSKNHLGPAELVLLTPQPDAVIRQNSASINCPDAQSDDEPNPAPYVISNQYRYGTWGRGYEISFTWKPFPAAASYRLFVVREGAQLPSIDRTVTEPYFDDRACNAFVIDSNLANWHWTVTALDRSGRTLATSETRIFAFAPCVLADGRPCSAPGPKR